LNSCRKGKIEACRLTTSIDCQSIKSRVRTKVLKSRICFQVSDPPGAIFHSSPKPFKCGIKVTQRRVNDADFVREQALSPAQSAKLLNNPKSF
jgi:hypothetical protein